MAAITISRQLGSEGSYIARKAAEKLGYHCVDKSAIEEILSGYGLVQFDNVYESVPGFWARFDRLTLETINLLNRTILALANQGQVVIVGRGSFAILAGFTDVLNVRIQAPLSVRAQRVMERENINNFDQARTIVTESDRVRSAFLESFYRLRWDEASAFDLVIDTGKVSRDLAITWLVQAYRALQESQSDREPATGAIEVDPILAKAVATALGRL